jgi:hypothetical protein
MAHYDVQVVLQGTSMLPDDVFVNTLHYEVNFPDTVQGTVDEIADAYVAYAPKLGGLDSMIVKAYAEGLNPSGPEATALRDLKPVITSVSGPTQVCCCLSYATVDDPESSTPRRRGRIYIGPFRAAATSNPRPDAAEQDAVLGLGQALASVGTASNTTWLMRSKVDNTYAKIESIWTDDSWDIQRRRSLTPTARRVQDVQ